MVIVNLWHGKLLRANSHDESILTISEHASQTHRTLLLHRVIHILAALVFLSLGLYHLLRGIYLEAACAIIIASTFDILQVLTLSKKSAKNVFAVNLHAVTAWIMGMAYIVYASFTASYSGLGYWVVLILCLSFVILLIMAFVKKFKKFWLMQHGYFWLLAIVITSAHIKLIFAM